MDDENVSASDDADRSTVSLVVDGDEVWVREGEDEGVVKKLEELPVVEVGVVCGY